VDLICCEELLAVGDYGGCGLRIGAGLPIKYCGNCGIGPFICWRWMLGNGKLEGRQCAGDLRNRMVRMDVSEEATVWLEVFINWNSDIFSSRLEMRMLVLV